MKCTKIKFEVHLRKGRTAALPGECPAWSIAFSQQGRKILDKWPASAVEELQNAYGHSHNRERTLERKSLRVGLSKVETKHNNLESWMAARLNFFFPFPSGSRPKGIKFGRHVSHSPSIKQGPGCLKPRERGR